MPQQKSKRQATPLEYLTLRIPRSALCLPMPCWLVSQGRGAEQNFSRSSWWRPSISPASKSPPIFDIAKLEYFNATYLRALPGEEFARVAMPFIRQAVKNPAVDASEIAALLQARCEKLTEIPEKVDFFDALPPYDAEFFTNKKSKTDATVSLEMLEKVLPVLESLRWTTSHSRHSIALDEAGCKRCHIDVPVRIACRHLVTPAGPSGSSFWSRRNLAASSLAGVLKPLFSLSGRNFSFGTAPAFPGAQVPCARFSSFLGAFGSAWLTGASELISPHTQATSAPNYRRHGNLRQGVFSQQVRPLLCVFGLFLFTSRLRGPPSAAGVAAAYYDPQAGCRLWDIPRLPPHVSLTPACSFFALGCSAALRSPRAARTSRTARHGLPLSDVPGVRSPDRTAAAGRRTDGVLCHSADCLVFQLMILRKRNAANE